MGNNPSDIAIIQQEKNVLRLEIASREGGVGLTGRSAELLRRSPAYRQAKQVFVDGEQSLLQVRINCLADGKELVMPSPGLKDGFCIFKPYAIPFRELSFAVSLKGVAKFGRKLDEKQVAGLDLALLVTDAAAVDRQGGRLGDGSGFFDLSYAVLSCLGAVSKTAQIATFIAGENIVADSLPTTCWDVRVNILVTEHEVIALADTPSPVAEIFWDHLAPKRIRKMKPLWLIKKQMSEDSGGQKS